jgi:hypothetical protein
MLISLRAIYVIAKTVAKLNINVIAGIVVSREPNPHPPKAPAIKDDTPVKFSQLLVFTSRKSTRKDLFQIAKVTAEAIRRVDKLISLFSLLFMCS